jgi:hypothetical protein
MTMSPGTSSWPGVRRFDDSDLGAETLDWRAGNPYSNAITAYRKGLTALWCSSGNAWRGL